MSSTKVSVGWVMFALILLAMAPVSYVLDLHHTVAEFFGNEAGFARPWVLVLLWLIPGVAILLAQKQRYDRRRLESFVSLSLVPKLVPSESLQRRKLKGIFLSLAWFFFVLAAAGPQWGTRVRILQRKGIDVVVAVDVSESMLAKDMPTAHHNKFQRRLTLARKKVRYLMELLAGERIGILAFSGQPVMLCPLTIDYNTCAIWLDSFKPDLIPYGGTAIASTIRKAIPMFATSGQNSRALILITDGDDHEKDTIAAAKEAKKKGIRIYTLGIGSTKWTTITPDQLPPPPPGQMKDFRKIRTRLNKELLQKLSRITHGIYRQAEVSHRDIRAIYQHAKKMLKAHSHQSKRQVFREERFSFFLFLGLFFLLLEFALSERKGTG